ncbi:MAG TPA: DUF4097 family beta strand repeat-containing protein [Ktedonobacteraceae bacterium]|nr:DUF4097 family beta strand repeat-containing protein [Ktedonobacteraceae bacterium]
MSDQEMQFADPEWQPTRQRRSTHEQPPYVPVDVNDPPRQQTDGPKDAYDAGKAGGDGDYSRGYQAESSSYQYQESAEIPRQQARRHRRPWFWVMLGAIALAILIATPVGEDAILVLWRILLAVLISGGIIALFIAISRGRRSTSSTEKHTFSVGAQPKIIIKDNAGTIRVHPGGEEYQVVVQATKRKRILIGGEIEVHYDQNTAKNSITVKADNGWPFIGSKWVDFDITVPRNADLELKTDAGTITVNGINGQMSCITDAGTVKVTDAWLRGNSKLKTDAGTISFSGALDPSGSYQMTTDAGTVSVTLPPDASFRLDAKTDVGSINSDFPLTIQPNFPGGKARCDIGLPPYPSLKLRTDVGSISIRQSSD